MSQELVVKFKATAPDTLRYWIAIDNDDVQMNNGEAAVKLQQGQEHVLIWWMEGNAGDALSVSGKVGVREVVLVKESKVPAGTSKGAGYRRFTP